MSTIGRVDAHVHVFHPDVAEDRFRYFPQDAAFHEMYQAPDAQIIVTEQLVDAMDLAGISQSIACGFGWSTNELCREGNDAIIEAVRLYPSRVVGFGTVAPRDSLSEAIAEIDRLAAAGVRGLGELRPDTQGLLEMPSHDIESIADHLRGHGMGLLMHASEPVGRMYSGKGTATPERLYGLLERLRGIPVILAHAGGGLPFYANLRASEDVFADVYVDTAAMPYLYDPATIRALINSIGLDRVLFATDYPLMRQERVIEYLDKAGLTSGEMERVLQHNAEEFLRRVGAVRA
ncbi:MAG: amidohydrolase family protein [Chloroflexi bacterium]|nr:amidohydrolase family protein [Chloroflexota bacterium]